MQGEQSRARLTGCCARQGEALPRDWETPAIEAAINGDRECLQILRARGFKLGTSTWKVAASTAHINCLAFAVTHGYSLEDNVLGNAVICGHLACVEFLTRHGLPHRPYWYWLKDVSPDQMRCLKLMAYRGADFDPATLIVAAVHGNLDFVRWLHERGVPLWQHAEEEASRGVLVDWKLQAYNVVVYRPQVTPLTLVMPSNPLDLVPIWQALRYGSLHGAPVTPRVQAFLKEMLERSQAVLGCFKAAARKSQGPAAPEQRRAWASMAALPTVVVEEILILADLEIPEAMMCNQRLA